MLRDEHAASDATQETFLKALRYRESYKGGSGLSWVFTICDRICLDAIAQRNKHAPVAHNEDALASIVEDESAAPWSEERLLRDDLVAQLLQRADPQTQAIVVHRFFDELGAEEIAAKVGASERTIRRRLTDFFSAAKTFLQEVSKPLSPAPSAKDSDHAAQ